MSSITKQFIYSQQLYMAYVPNTVMYEAMLRDIPSPYLFYKMSCLYANTDKNVFLKLCLRVLINF